MVLPTINVLLERATINFIYFTNKHILFFPYKTSFRPFRGTRLGKYRRELDKTEAKFQQLLKSLKETSKKSVVNVPEFAEAVVKDPTPKKETFSSDKKNDMTNDIPCDDIHKRLESKMTPLKRLPYTRQLERKYAKCLSLLRMFGEKLRLLKVPLTLGEDRLPCPADLMVPSPVIEGYRNQDEFSFGVDLDGNSKTIGFYLANPLGGSSQSCVSPDELVIIKEIHKEFIRDLQNYVRQSPLPASVQSGDKGCWKSVGVRSNTAGDLMGIIMMHPQDLTKEQLHLEKENLRKYFETINKSYNLESLYFQACSESQSSREEAPFELLFGKPYITEVLNGMKFQLSPGSYFLSNTHAAETLYDSLRKWCRLSKHTTVLDLFCGTGLTSATLSAHVKQCIGMDPCAQNISDARSNAKLNNQCNVKFIHGNPENLLRSILNQDYYEDLLVIVNPGRLELSKIAVNSLRECKYLKKIIYISSKPKTTVENFIRLSKLSGGESYLGKYFVPLLAIPFDLSPQTEHYGLVLMFQRL